MTDSSGRVRPSLTFPLARIFFPPLSPVHLIARLQDSIETAVAA